MEAPTSTFSLLEKAQGGDRDALSTVFDRNQRRLRVLIYFKLKPEARQETDDVLQETMLRAWRDFETFSYRAPGSFFRWLASIAGHVIIDRARYEGRECRAGQNAGFRSESNPAGAEPADTKTPSRIFAQQESVERLIAQLDALPEDYRQAILMAKIEGLTTTEMAERLGKSREAVAVLVFRAVKRFRQLSEMLP